ncbi:unnamed protein product [marine sediment metagenome]|uniref:Uncharacterized protein n=1 Tax=marine sediment metagenome TaxID=412755 RepID=X1DXC2_9ZZZZ
MLKSFKDKLARALNPELIADNEKLLDVNDDCIDSMKALMEENRKLDLEVEALTVERDNLLGEVGSLKQKLAPKVATERRFGEIDYWD